MKPAKYTKNSINRGFLKFFEKPDPTRLEAYFSRSRPFGVLYSRIVFRQG